MLANAGYRGLGKVRRTLFSTLDIMEAVGESLFWHRHVHQMFS